MSKIRSKLLKKTKLLKPKIDENEEKLEENDEKVIRILPDFTANKVDKKIAFTLHVKNIEPPTVKILKSESFIEVKFTSTGEGYFPSFYSFYANFPERNLVNVKNDLSEANLVINLTFSEEPASKFFIGLDKNPNGLKEFDLDSLKIEENTKEFVKEEENVENTKTNYIDLWNLDFKNSQIIELF